MANERSPAASRNVMRLAHKMQNAKYRTAYVGAHVRQFLARQMRSLRGDMSQDEFGKLIGMPQSVISSRLENPNYGKWTLTSLLEIAAKLDLALIVRFVDYQTFLKLTNDQSEEAATPKPYDHARVEWAAPAIAAEEGKPTIIRASMGFAGETGTLPPPKGQRRPETSTRSVGLAVA